MRRFLALVLAVLVLASVLPAGAQARLICRITGAAMLPVPVEEAPHSCCALRADSSGEVRLANRSCCDLTITPGPNHTTSVLSAPLAPWAVVCSTDVLQVPLFTVDVTVARSPIRAVPLDRGPPRSPSAPRAPPADGPSD